MPQQSNDDPQVLAAERASGRRREAEPRILLDVARRDRGTPRGRRPVGRRIGRVERRSRFDADALLAAAQLSLAGGTGTVPPPLITRA